MLFPYFNHVEFFRFVRTVEIARAVNPEGATNRLLFDLVGDEKLTHSWNMSLSYAEL
jgi:hypothetical protein